jgi:hypothetical protein
MDRNQIAVYRHQMAQLDTQRATAIIWLVSLLMEHHGGAAAVGIDTLIAAQKQVYSVNPTENGEQRTVTFMVYDKDQKPVLRPLPTGVSAEAMAVQICQMSPDEIAHLDAASLAELLVAYHENVKRGEAQLARPPQIAEVVTTDPPPERCPECWLAYGAHRDDCSLAVAVESQVMAGAQG